MRSVFLAAGAMVVAATLPVHAMDITGEWSGKGRVQKNAQSRPVNVSCAIVGSQEGDEIGFEGECRAMLILKRAIGADITRDGEHYTGTYTGSNAGVAALDGGPADDGSIVLTMTFPKEVNGDDTATMRIETPNEGSFTITTVDKMATGEDVTTSQITFERK